MSYYVTFKSRTNAVRFYDRIKANGGQAALVSPPRSLSSCGLSVKVNDLAEAKFILSAGDYTMFCGIYKYDINNDLIKVY